MSETQLTRIVYMEDDSGLARLLKKRLDRHGFLVDLAVNGEEGLALLQENRYAVALVDYNMPVMSGMEVMLRASQMEQAPPVIMLTGDGNEKIAVEVMKLGAADYLVKDVDMGYLELLPVVIEQVLQRERLAKERGEILNEAMESEERYRRLVELSPDGITILYAGRIEFINFSGAAILGAQSCEELIDREWLNFVHPSLHQIVRERMQLMQESSVELPWLEEKYLKCDGSEVDVEVAALPFVCDGKQSHQVIFRDITERKASERRLELLAKYDALTGLPNRSFFFDRLSQLILQGKRDQSMFALLFIDLDRFKEANDRLGHACGDLLLKEVALRLVSCVRQSDTVARMGGDEFVVILTKIMDKADAALLAQRLVESIGVPFSIQGKACELSASIGISLYPEDGENQEEQLVKADTAMYRSKRLGRNTYQFYTPDGADQRHQAGGNRL